jgi:uncharacterized membrane protein
MLLSFAIRVQNTPFFTYLRGSPSYVYPAILAMHMLALALFGGMVLMTDLRLLGWAMRKRSVGDVVNQLRAPKRVGFVIAATLGLLLLGTKAEVYYFNIFFRTKAALFVLVAVHAMVFRGSVYNRAAEIDRAPQIPGRAKLAAGLSLLLWIGIFSAGRGIGYLWIPGGMHLAPYFP